MKILIIKKICIRGFVIILFFALSATLTNLKLQQINQQPLNYLLREQLVRQMIPVPRQNDSPLSETGKAMFLASEMYVCLK